MDNSRAPLEKLGELVLNISLLGAGTSTDENLDVERFDFSSEISSTVKIAFKCRWSSIKSRIIFGNYTNYIENERSGKFKLLNFFLKEISFNSCHSIFFNFERNLRALVLD